MPRASSSSYNPNESSSITTREGAGAGFLEKDFSEKKYLLLHTARAHPESRIHIRQIG
jgi:hypothetical protein